MTVSPSCVACSCRTTATVRLMSSRKRREADPRPVTWRPCRSAGTGGVVPGGEAAPRPAEKEDAVEFLLILSEDVDLVGTDEDRAGLAQRTGEYAMRLVGEGRLKAGGRLRPAGEARRARTRQDQTPVLDGPFVAT